MPKDPNEIGALWIKSGARGEFLTGNVNGEKIVAFKNTRKTAENQPDYRILKSQPRDSQPAARPVDGDEF